MADPVVVWSIGSDGVVTFTIGDDKVVFTEPDGLAAFAASVEQARVCRSTFEASGYEAAQRFADGIFGTPEVPDGDFASVLDHTGEGIQVVNVADLEREPSSAETSTRSSTVCTRPDCRTTSRSAPVAGVTRLRGRMAAGVRSGRTRNAS